MSAPLEVTGLLAALSEGRLAPGTSLQRARDALDHLPAGDRVLRHRFEAEGDRNGAWWGIPYLTKANLAVLDQPLDCCSAILEGFRAPYEATATARLRTAGATCLGATNMDEFAMGGSGETSVQGAPGHPFLEGRVCGGSSSGSAAAVARGLVPFALGSDTGGSVRQPAAYCGLVGLKPTWGRVSRHGLVAHASSLDTVGVLANSVADAAAVLGIIEGADGLDATVDPAFARREPRPLRSVGLLLPREGEVTDEVRTGLAAVGDGLRGRGVPVAMETIDALGASLAAYVVLAAAEAASNLARYDGSLYGARVEAGSYAASVARTRAAGFGEEVKLRVLLGTEVLRQGHTADALRRAREVVRRLAGEFDAILERHEALLMPTVPSTAFRMGTRVGDPLSMRDADRFTVGPSLLGLPAVAVPSGEGEDGAPLSVQCVAARGDDGTALALAARVEEVVGRTGLRKSWFARTREGRR